jgi:hypothetical protein
MSKNAVVNSTQEHPRDAVFEILDTIIQFDSLTVESGETVTIPSDEVWAVSNDPTIEGELIIEGGLVQDTIWPYGTPEIAKWEDTTMKGKQNASDTYIYVHKPEGDGIDRFSASGDLLNETDTIRLSVWYPGNVNDSPGSDVRAKAYRDNLIDLFQTYMNDNFQNSTFHNIEPTDATDFRHQAIARQTDHYIYGVTVEADRLQ